MKPEYGSPIPTMLDLSTIVTGHIVSCMKQKSFKKIFKKMEGDGVLSHSNYLVIQQQIIFVSLVVTASDVLPGNLECI